MQGGEKVNWLIAELSRSKQARYVSVRVPEEYRPVCSSDVVRNEKSHRQLSKAHDH